MSENHTYAGNDDELNPLQENEDIIAPQEEIPSGGEMASGESSPVYGEDVPDISSGEVPDVDDNADHQGTKAEPAAGPSWEDRIENIAKEESDTSHPFSISGAVGGGIIAGYVKNNISLVLLIAAFIIIYIHNRYQCQQLLVKINDMEIVLSKEHYKATVCTSELTRESRESNILQLLSSYGDSTLALPSDPPYLIQVPVDEEVPRDQR